MKYIILILVVISFVAGNVTSNTFSADLNMVCIEFVDKNDSDYNSQEHEVCDHETIEFINASHIEFISSRDESYLSLHSEYSFFLYNLSHRPPIV